jgi:transcriptional regulator with XRE-family HTH domain
MTGNDVQRLRQQIGWSAQQFADLLGVHASTVYRWEGTDAPLSVDPLQRDLLMALNEWWARSAPAQRANLRDKVQTAKVRGGNLRALRTLLNSVVADAA